MAANRRVYSFTGLTDPPPMLGNVPGRGSAYCTRRSDEFTDVTANCSPLQRARRQWQPVLPVTLRDRRYKIVNDENVQNPKLTDEKVLADLFPTTWGQKFVKFLRSATEQASESTTPLRVGVVLSGGQAAGGHNVIAGLFDYVKSCNSQSQLIGFLNGPAGIVKHDYKEIGEELMAQYRNMGGFDIICSGRDKIETAEQKQASMEICRKLDLHGLVIIGGDDSNTNGAILAEYFKSKDCQTKVVGVPKTIDGDLRNEYIETSFGFDTAVKTYSELIGNLCADAATSQDRYHFVRLMGRSASNIALECALQSRANLTFIGEEVEAESKSLKSISREICEMIQKRYEMGKEYGVILLPEGLIEFIPEIGKLIREINDILGEQQSTKLTPDDTTNLIIAKLSNESRQLFNDLPESIRSELLLERDSHGNVQVSKIATEKLLILMVREELAKLEKEVPFIPTDHFFGYEGRCAMPSNFDANYCYALGHTAGGLLSNGFTGYMAVVRNLKKPAEEWIPGGCPITIMMNIEKRKGKNVPVIKKYLVELNKSLFQNFKKARDDWKYKDLYRNVGPIQFIGESSNITNFTIDPPSANYLLPVVEKTTNKCWVTKSINVLSKLQIERLHYKSVLSSDLTNLKTRALVAKKWESAEGPATERFIRRFFPLQCELHGMRAYAVQPIEEVDFDGTGASESSKRLPSTAPGRNPAAGASSGGATAALRIGVVLTGQPVPGATNVVMGLFDRLSLQGGKLIGFKGISGLLSGTHVVIEKNDLSLYVNQGGFELLGRTAKSKHILRTDQGISKVGQVCKELELDGLVMIGGQTSLTDAAVLAEFFLNNNIPTRIIGVPANQENNVQHPLLEAAIGFDTASKTYASLIGNLLTDAASATKYWYFVRLMGNVPSHITMEVALETHPNFTLVSEKYVAENMSLRDVVRDIADVVARRASKGKNFGTVLIPEGVVSSIPQMKALLTEIDSLFVKNLDSPDALAEIRTTIVNLDTKNAYYQQLTPWSAGLLSTLPQFFREQLVRKTPSGRLELSEIAAEQLIAGWVAYELSERKALGSYSGSFNPICHYFGFQGRSALPTNFDCALATSHGYLAAILVESGLTGFTTSVRGLCSAPSDWRFSGVPIAVLLKILPDYETAAFGRKVPIVPCADVDLKGSAYQAFSQGNELWETEDLFCNPGPIQYSGVGADSFNRTLLEEQADYMVMLEQLEELLGLVGGVCSFGVKKATLKTAVISLGALAAILGDSASQ